MSGLGYCQSTGENIMSWMKQALRATAAAAVLAAVAAGPVKAADYNWKLTSYVPVGSGSWKVYMQEFIDLTHQLTDGKVKIKGFSVGVLASPFDAWKAVQKGTADICFCYPGFAVNTDPSNGIFAGMVGGMPTETFQHWMFGGGGGKLLRDFRHETQKLHPVITGFGPTEIFLHAHKKVQTVADLKGMKIRTAGAWADILKSLGAAPTTLAPPDIYTALERRVIDGTEFITPWTNYKLGFHKIAKYIMVPGIHSPTHLNEAVFKLDLWNKLPKDLQNKITIAGEVAGFRSNISLGLNDLGAMKKLQAGRNTWVEIDQSLKDKIFELGRSWSKEQAKKQTAKGNPWMEKVSGSYWGFYDKFLKYGTYRHK
jgi:TRAP-type mannitol/chloroaromatic compound transport system substrate-binding protein